MDTLQKINLKKLHSELNTPNKKLAFWINTYNSLVQIRLIENPNIFEDKNAFFKKNDILIGGEKLSLNDIENGIMRLKTDENITNLFITKKFMLKTLENRIHFTLNCGATSCPAIAYYNPDELEQQLEGATRFYVENNCEYDAEKNEVLISELFSWFKDDFVTEFLESRNFTIDESKDLKMMISSRIAELQHNRKGNSAGRISASPTSIVNAVKSGKLSLDDLQKALASLE